jgi:hypothetical protein
MEEKFSNKLNKLNLSDNQLNEFNKISEINQELKNNIKTSKEN